MYDYDKDDIVGAIRYAAHEIGKEGATGMGALEGLGVQVEKIADAIGALPEVPNELNVCLYCSSRLYDGIERIAIALENIAKK